MHMLASSYAAGLSDERLVKNFLAGKGLLVEEPTRDQDRLEDTDCLVNGVAVSIKAEHSGLKYRNIYFELAQHLTEHKDCGYSASVCRNKRDYKQLDVDGLVAHGSWEASWYYKGKAPVYYILQGDTLRIYKKADILAYVAAHGWLRIRALSAFRSSYLGGTYRYCNALCGFLDTESVKHLKYKLIRN
jgi:hypothetical protein